MYFQFLNIQVNIYLVFASYNVPGEHLPFAYFLLITHPCCSSDKRLISSPVKRHSSSLAKETYTKVMTARGRACVLTPVMNVQR